MLTLFLNRQLAVRLEENSRKGKQQLIEAWNTLEQTSSVKAIEFDGVLALYAGPEYEINEVFGLGMSSQIDRQVLVRIEEFYKSHDDSCVIQVCPLAHPSLIETIQECGYDLSSFSYRWLLDLSSWQSPFDEVDPRIRVARTTEELEWARTVVAGSADKDDLSEDDHLDLARAFFRMTSSVPVLAEENGKTVAAGTLALNGEIATLFSTSTLPTYRKRGLQTALLDWRLKFAKEQGARIATIETAPDSDSQRNVERMGFRLAYVTSHLKKTMSSQ